MGWLPGTDPQVVKDVSELRSCIEASTKATDKHNKIMIWLTVATIALAIVNTLLFIVQVFGFVK